MSRLQRLDERWTGRGPLALLRRAPQVVALVLVLVLATGVGVVLAQDSGQVADATGPTRLGPAPGAAVEDYLATTRSRLDSAVAEDPDAARGALVLFNRYRSVAELTDVLDRVEVSQVLGRVPLPAYDTDPFTVLVQDFPADLTSALATRADRRRADAQSLTAFASSIDASNPEDMQFQRVARQSAMTAAAEAYALDLGCTCLYAALVQGTTATLGRLAGREGVRAVDLAPAGTDASSLLVNGLLPEDADVAPQS